MSKAAHDMDKERADQPSGVPAGSGLPGHGSGYDEPRSGTSCQNTAAARDCTGSSPRKLLDVAVSICKAGNSLLHLLSIYLYCFESPFSPNTEFINSL